MTPFEKPVAASKAERVGNESGIQAPGGARHFSAFSAFPILGAALLVPFCTPRSRNLEAELVAAMQRSIGSVNSRAIGDGRVLVIGTRTVVAQITASCSGLPLALIIGAVALGINTESNWFKRIRYALATASVVFAINLIRVCLTVLLGSRFGLDPMTIFHDWAGSAMTIVGGVVAILLLVRSVSSPRSSKRREVGS
jgi:exosortase/archaeosortase family protein